MHKRSGAVRAERSVLPQSLPQSITRSINPRSISVNGFPSSVNRGRCSRTTSECTRNYRSLAWAFWCLPVCSEGKWFPSLAILPANWSDHRCYLVSMPDNLCPPTEFTFTHNQQVPHRKVSNSTIPYRCTELHVPKSHCSQCQGLVSETSNFSSLLIELHPTRGYSISRYKDDTCIAHELEAFRFTSFL